MVINRVCAHIIFSLTTTEYCFYVSRSLWKFDRCVQCFANMLQAPVSAAFPQPNIYSVNIMSETRRSTSDEESYEWHLRYFTQVSLYKSFIGYHHICCSLYNSFGELPIWRKNPIKAGLQKNSFNPLNPNFCFFKRSDNLKMLLFCYVTIVTMCY